MYKYKNKLTVKKGMKRYVAMDAYDKMTRNSAKKNIAPKPEDFGNVPNKTDGGSPSEN